MESQTSQSTSTAAQVKTDQRSVEDQACTKHGHSRTFSSQLCNSGTRKKQVDKRVLNCFKKQMLGFQFHSCLSLFKAYHFLNHFILEECQSAQKIVGMKILSKVNKLRMICAYCIITGNLNSFIRNCNKFITTYSTEAQNIDRSSEQKLHPI
ncbi:hypothetical protein L6164_008774 [Bauhinia variegata]|uniref:Uncharacterized protein n=1 Tax=Bauhinia variegata TaxID=167791 RepID=A0ACB9PHT2_BAUVA|nr:hypothetical protein L6164_008774 [Bauhinia variegata]